MKLVAVNFFFKGASVEFHCGRVTVRIMNDVGCRIVRHGDNPWASRSAEDPEACTGRKFRPCKEHALELVGNAAKQTGIFKKGGAS